MRMIHLRLPGKLLAHAACLALAAGAAGCQDAGGDPTALILTEDSHPAVVLARELPSLPGLAGDGRIEPQVTGAIDRWIGSWALPREEGQGQRAASYAEAARPLADGLGAGGVGDALARLELVLDAAGRLPAQDLPQGVAERLAAARAEALAARQALDAGALTDAVSATLHGADLLREVGPEGVARTLIARAEGGLSWGGSPASPVDIVRAQRLVAGARQAAAEGEYALAIQRAYYACQLVGVALE
jgi:hypothetical protein